jgi:hypothetical protein
MKDFIGQPINVGDYLAAGGTGNTTCEYGMILVKVLKVGKNLTVHRLKATHLVEPLIAVRKVTIRNPNKYVKIDPPKEAADLFTRIVSGSYNPNDAKLTAKWLHGQSIW